MWLFWFFFLSFLIFLLLSLSDPKGRNAPGKPVREVSEMQTHCRGFCLSQLAFCAQHACDSSTGLLGLGDGRGLVLFCSRFGLILLSAFPMCAAAVVYLSTFSGDTVSSGICIFLQPPRGRNSGVGRRKYYIEIKLMYNKCCHQMCCTH